MFYYKQRKLLVSKRNKKYKKFELLLIELLSVNNCNTRGTILDKDKIYLV